MNFIGKQIGNYQLVVAINSGGYGSVYRANHTILSGRIVAVKLLHTHLDSDKEREKFLQEACLLEMLSHRYILPILDVGFTDGLPYIVVEYAPGGSLRDRLKRQASGLLPAEEARRLLMQVGQALEHAHQQNIIHRDLKPENILFNAQGEALLSDFGIATVVETSMRLTGIMGSPTYMAPEQFHGTVSKEVDQYALGCLAYELYTGRKVFEAPDFLAMAVQHATKAPIPPRRYNPQLPGHIEQAILRALAKKRTDRYPGISDFLHALSRAPEGESDVPPTVGTGGFSLENWLSEGEAHLRLNRSKEALAVFERILQFAPANVASLIGKGKSLSALQRYEEAEQAFQEVVRLEPGNPSHRKALEEIRAQLKQDKAVSLYKQGNILSTSKQYEQALVAFAEAVRLEPGNADYQKGRGRALSSLQRYEEALGAFKEAVRLAPKVPDHLRWQGEALYQLKRYQGALEAFEKAVLLEPKVGYYHKMQGEILCELKRYEEALHAFEKGALLEPGNPSHRKRQEQIRAQLKQDEEDRSRSKAASLYKQGNTLSTSKQYGQALVAFAEAVRLEPGNADYQNARGRTFSSLQRYEEALGAFKEAARLQPKVSTHLQMQAELLWELKRYKEALVMYEQAISLESRRDYRKRLEELRAQLKQSEEARSGSKSKEKEQPSAKKSVPQEPANKAASLYKQGNILSTSKQYGQALVAYREAVQLEPDKVNYRQALGRTFSSLQRYEEALGAFREAARLQPRVPTHLQMQAEILWKLKRYEEALAMYEQAISLEPRRAYRQRLQQLRAQLKQQETGSQKFSNRAQLKPQETGLQKFLNFFRI